jgi:hypothetical protein
MLFTAKVQHGGKTENEALRRLNSFKVVKTYDKDGIRQDAIELIKASLTQAIDAVANAIGTEAPTEMWKAPNWREYNHR